MILFLLAYLGGVLTIVSPCILPVLPFVFARADQPFLRSGLPMLAGMAVMFAAVATLGGIGGGWVVQANEYGRIAATVLLAIFGVALLFPSLSDRLMRPVVALGARLSQSADRRAEAGASTILPSLLLGIATGLLWAPCAGPVLGLILTGAALQGASVHTSLLLATYAAGAATSLALALLVGGRVFAAMKRSLGAGEWIRKGLGVAVLAAVAAITLGLDTGFLTNLSLASTTAVEQSLVDRLRAAPDNKTRTNTSIASSDAANAMKDTSMAMTGPARPAGAEGSSGDNAMALLAGAVEWLNTPPMTAQMLKGKVVLVDFWTYSCINCLRSIPYVRAWAEKYKDRGLVVIGVHSPEFPFERNVANVKKAIASLKIDYPVAIDNNYAIWKAFDNQYWPAHYLIDANGRIRDSQFGEGGYDETERSIQQLLAEAGKTDVPSALVEVKTSGVEAAADMSDVKSPETYIGYNRSENFISPGAQAHDVPRVYAVGTPKLNEWGLSGDWTVGGEHATLNQKDGSIVYRFHARVLHLVLGAGSKTGSVRFHVTIDGKAPGASHGADTDAEGNGVVTDERLYQLVRQSGAVADHTFEIHFLDPGVEAYSFTFG